MEPSMQTLISSASIATGASEFAGARLAPALEMRARRERSSLKERCAQEA